MILLLAAIYLSPILLPSLFEPAQNLGISNYLLVWAVFYLLAVTWALISALRLLKRGDTNKLRLRMALTKLLAAPAFILSFIFWAAVGFMAFLIPGAQIALLAAPVIAGLAYVIFASTAIYSVAYIIGSRRESKLSNTAALAHIAAQFVFVIDIISVIVLLKTVRKNQ